MTATLPAPRALRDYQIEAVDAVIDAWAADERRVGVVAATGLGKSTIIAALAVRAADMGLRVVMIAHRAELLAQMADTVAAVDPAREPVGIVRAEHDEHDRQIVAATVQTLTSDRRRERVGHRDVILWDEVHHIGAESWHQVLVDLGGYDGAFVAGFTATMQRADGVALGDVMSRVVFERDLRWAVEHGHLVTPTGLTVHMPAIDLRKIKTVAGDYHQGELAEVMEAATESVVHAIITHAPDRRPIIFAAGVDAAHGLADALTAVGVPAEAVDGTMPHDEREPVYQRFRDGTVQALVTVQVLTEGADFPMCDAAVIARPTKSQTLYSQMVGRALRQYPGKTDALVLDLVGVSRVMSPVTVTRLLPDAETRHVDEDGAVLDPDDYEEPPAPAVKQRREGPLNLVEFDLLSHDAVVAEALWLKTEAGIPFLTQPDHVVFLWPHGAGLYRVGHMTLKGPKRGDWITHPVTEDKAVAAAHKHMIDEFGKIPSRSASWRQGRAPSDAQINYARTLGIPDPEHKTRARLSDDISVRVTSARIDPR